ncbi:MAG: DNA polymerase III subunit delta [Geminicoccaceae bacterium]|nr:DNA polymerase III subunit delta [Geminicoccaceae bacterium]
MKLPSARIERFLDAPDPAFRLVLLYGSDGGLIAERAARLARAVAGDPGDPFRVSELDPERVASEPRRLLLEAQALCFGGGRRLVRIRGAEDALAPAVAALLGLEACDGFVVIEAGELAANSKLRQLVERAENAVAIGCWQESERDRPATVRNLLAEHGLRAEPEALRLLVDRLGADRGLSRSEIAKLALYVGPDRRGVTVADVEAVVEEAAAFGTEELVLAALLAETGRVEQDLQRLLGAGEAPARILRVASGLIVRLLRLRAELDAGAPLATVLEEARPPVHFRIRPKVEAVLRRWPSAALESELVGLLEAERAAKSASLYAALICRRALAGLADRAALFRKAT